MMTLGAVLLIAGCSGSLGFICGLAQGIEEERRRLRERMKRLK